MVAAMWRSLAFEQRAHRDIAQLACGPTSFGMQSADLGSMAFHLHCIFPRRAASKRGSIFGLDPTACTTIQNRVTAHADKRHEFAFISFNAEKLFCDFYARKILSAAITRIWHVVLLAFLHRHRSAVRKRGRSLELLSATENKVAVSQ